MTAPPTPPTIWTPAELAAHYKVSKRSIYREIESGRMVAIRIGALRVSEFDRVRWEQAARVAPAKPDSDHEAAELSRPYRSPFTTAEDLRDAVRFGLV